MAHRLAVRSDEVHRLRLQAGLGNSGQGRLRQRLAEQKIYPAEIVDERVRKKQLKQVALKVGVELRRRVGQHVELRRLPGAGDVDEHGIDCVSRRAAHEPDDSPRFLARDLFEYEHCPHLPTAAGADEPRLGVSTAPAVTTTRPKRIPKTAAKRPFTIEPSLMPSVSIARRMATMPAAKARI